MENEQERIIKMHKTQRRNKKIRLATIGSTLLIIGATMLNIYTQDNKNIYNNYKENANVNYRVKIKENEFYEDEYLDEQTTAIASLIENIDINFNYKIELEKKQDYAYSYKIIAKTSVKEGTRENTIFEQSEELIEKPIVNTQNSKELEINEKVLIDYNQYNQKINKFISLYNLDDTTSTLDIEMYVYATDIKNGEQINKNDKVMSLSMPLTTKTINIGISKNVIKDEGKILIQENQEEKTILLYIGTALITLGTIVIIAFIKYMLDTRSAEKMYEQELRKILFNYKSYIQQANNTINENEYKTIQINTFDEILGLKETLQAPILMYTEENELQTKFMIINEGILYKYILGAKEIREELRRRANQN